MLTVSCKSLWEMKCLCRDPVMEYHHIKFAWFATGPHHQWKLFACSFCSWCSTVEAQGHVWSGLGIQDSAKQEAVLLFMWHSGCCWDLQGSGGSCFSMWRRQLRLLMRSQRLLPHPATVIEFVGVRCPRQLRLTRPLAQGGPLQGLHRSSAGE